MIEMQNDQIWVNESVKQIHFPPDNIRNFQLRTSSFSILVVLGPDCGRRGGWGPSGQPWRGWAVEFFEASVSRAC